MSRFDHRKYRPFPPIPMAARRWPDRVIERAPRWCAVDLRDGNQALVEPMNVAEKQRLFDLLVKLGFKEIEVGFPAASAPDFQFVRSLIDGDRVPQGVALQVLTQARQDLIEKSFDALRGAAKAVVHLYNSTSRIQRERVFQLDRQGIIDIAVRGAEMIRQRAERQPETQWVFQYSPESFSGTELDFAVAICEAVMGVWEPTPERRMIVNLPATVEMATPNVFADQVEWFGDHIRHRDALILSVHTHNDRGSAVAAAELAVMAGADRVEGTLLGNGERTGNMDIVTMAMNLYSQGVDPELDLSGMDEIVRTLEAVTRIPVHPRHPYAGELVYTAFSGSHQDAIRKCIKRQREGEPWEVAYLPIDPADLGRSYEEVIRINSQSGKGGVAYVLERDQGITLPRWVQIEFSKVVQQDAETRATEVTPARIWELFQQSYLDRPGPYRLQAYHIDRQEQDSVRVELARDGVITLLQGSGAGALEALVAAMQRQFGIALEITAYEEHAMSGGTDALAACFVQLKCDGERRTGVAMHRDSVAAVLSAVVAAFNRHLAEAGQAQCH